MRRSEAYNLDMKVEVKKIKSKIQYGLLLVLIGGPFACAFAGENLPTRIEDKQLNKYLNENLEALKKGGVNLKDKTTLNRMVKTYAEAFAQDMNATAVSRGENWTFVCSDGTDPTTQPTRSCTNGTATTNRAPTSLVDEKSQPQSPSTRDSASEYIPSAPMINSLAQAMNYRSAATHTPRGKCDFESGTEVFKRFERIRRKCLNQSSRAQKNCSNAGNKRLMAAISTAQSTMNLFKGATGKSASSACQSMSDNSKTLSSALKRYVRKCAPSKRSCENHCLSASRSAKLIFQNLARNPFCYKQLKKHSTRLKQMSDLTTNRLLRCYSFERQMIQSDQSAGTLLTALSRYKKCESALSEYDCTIDPHTGKCASSLNTASTNTPSSASTTGNNTSQDTHKKPVKPQEQTFNKTAIFAPTGSIAKSIGSKSNSRKKSPAKLTAGAAKNAQGSLFKAHEKPKKMYKFSIYSVPDHDNKKASSKRKVASQTDRTDPKLASYLPGGSNDPNNQIGPDGLTHALGPGIFEKVSRRYQLHKNRLIKQ